MRILTILWQISYSIVITSSQHYGYALHVRISQCQLLRCLRQHMLSHSVM